MNDIQEFQSIPIGSLVPFSSEKRLYYINKVFSLSQGIQNLLFSPRTGAFLRGIIKTSDISSNKARGLSFAVLKTSVGELELNQLSIHLSSELGISREKAENITKEIERDLFAPVMMELGKVQKTGAEENAPPPLRPSYAGQASSSPFNKGESRRPPAQPSPRLRPAGAPPATMGGRPELSGMSNVLDLKEQKRPPSPPPIR